MITKNLLVLLVLLVALLGCYWYLLAHKRIPCVTPITYSVIELDERFGISPKEAHQYAHDAAALWNEALRKEVFVEQADPELPISFVYDRTQYSIDTVASLNDDIDKLQQERSSVSNKYVALKKQYDSLERQGRATTGMKAKLDTLLTTYYDLKRQIDADRAAGRHLPEQGEIQEGRYILDRSGTRIFIYGFQSTTELKRVLIHEFGHALGLGHVSERGAIMYPDNSDTNLQLARADLEELDRACRDK